MYISRLTQLIALGTTLVAFICTCIAAFASYASDATLNQISSAYGSAGFGLALYIMAFIAEILLMVFICVVLFCPCMEERLSLFLLVEFCTILVTFIFQLIAVCLTSKFGGFAVAMGGSSIALNLVATVTLAVGYFKVRGGEDADVC